MNAKGRVKEDGAFKFYEEARAYWHELSRTTHDPRQLVNLGSVLTSKTSK